MAKTHEFHQQSQKHLTMTERIDIQSGLDSGLSVREIARSLNRSPSTISREIKSHTTHYKPKKNCCIHKDCKKQHVCKDRNCYRQCITCTKCTYTCSDYEEIWCKKMLSHPLHLCNGCSSWNFCRNRRAKYEAESANNQARKALVESRNGFDLSDENIQEINSLISPMIKAGQSPYAIKQSLGNSLPISEATLRRLVSSCKLDVRNIDLRDKVRRKQRKKRRRTMKDEIVTINKTGHLYSDYQDYLLNNTDANIVQMDCVEGLVSDEKTLLTLHFPLFHFQIAVLMEHHTSRCVVEALDYIEEKIGQNLFQHIFEVILTDNGHEFTNIAGMERSKFGGQRTKIFFCEPNRSDQKAECETNHKLIRYVLPKKTSFEFLTQEKVTLMMNNINNYPRKSLGGKTPMIMAQMCFPRKFFEELGLNYILPRFAKLTPDLLKK